MKNVDNSETINVLSLCTGYGGLELGLSRALEGIFRVVAVEVEAYALANLAAKAQGGKLAIEAMWPDLKTFPAERFRGCFDFILAGYPCQGESKAGKMLGDKDSRWLWPDIKRIIKAVKPIWFFGENVEGHFNKGFPLVCCDLEKMGYEIEAGFFSAAEIGGLHRRKRLFFLAYSDNNRLPFPKLRQSSCNKRIEQTQAEPFLLADWPPRPEQVSKIPRMPYDVANRLDRLRLLGNGVVPQQAEKAFRTLYGNYLNENGEPSDSIPFERICR